MAFVQRSGMPQLSPRRIAPDPDLSRTLGLVLSFSRDYAILIWQRSRALDRFPYTDALRQRTSLTQKKAGGWFPE
jgi:hypothetical protein